MSAMSANPLSIYPHVCVSAWSVIRTLTFSDIYKVLNTVALYALMSVLATYITLPQLSNLKSKNLFSFSEGKLHLIINFIILI